MPIARFGVFCMKKLTALFLALCLILAILIFNAPDINYGQGLSDISVPTYRNVLLDDPGQPI